MRPVELDDLSTVEGSLMPNHRPWSTPGGTEYEPTTFNKATLRAELVEIANQVSFAHGQAIIDKILARYDVKRRPIKEKK